MGFLTSFSLALSHPLPPSGSLPETTRLDRRARCTANSEASRHRLGLLWPSGPDCGIRFTRQRGPEQKHAALHFACHTFVAVKLLHVLHSPGKCRTIALPQIVNAFKSPATILKALAFRDRVGSQREVATIP